MTIITIDLGDHEIPAELGDGPAATSLLSQLPLSVEVRDFGGQEKIGGLPHSLDIAGEPAGSSAPAGTIGYWTPDAALVLYYRDVARYDGIVPLGTLDDVAAVVGIADGTTVTLRHRDA